jgi:hypothetical protein
MRFTQIMHIKKKCNYVYMDKRKEFNRKLTGANSRSSFPYRHPDRLESEFSRCEKLHINAMPLGNGGNRL